MFLDMENPDNSQIKNYEDLNLWIKEHCKKNRHNYLLIDEVQEIIEFEKALRWWIKQDKMDIIVTGSNAMMLSSDIASTFAGRYFQVHIYSLSYSEFLLFHNLQHSQQALVAYLRWGGLPFLKNIPAEDTRTRADYLCSIYDTIFVRDILNRKQIRNTAFIDNLARFVADNSGKLFSSNSIAKFMKGKGISVSSNTISDYMDTLCATYMIDRVERYDIKGKKIFEQQEKYYFEELGIRNYLCRSIRQWDLEKVLENAVYIKLRMMGYNVYVGQFEGKEIDFVAKRGDEMAYYQVSLQISNSETYEREFGNLKLIKDNYPKYLLTRNDLIQHRGGILHFNAAPFMMENRLF